MVKFLMFHKVLEGWNNTKAYKIKGLQLVFYIKLLSYLINIYMKPFFFYFCISTVVYLYVFTLFPREYREKHGTIEQYQKTPRESHIE